MFTIIILSVFTVSFSLCSMELDINNLTLEEKIGQLCIIPVVSNVERNKRFIECSPYHLDPEYVQKMIKKYYVGGVIYLGHGIPSEQVEQTNKMHKLSKYPLLIAQDLEWGLSMKLQQDVIVYPKAMTLGALAPEDDYLIYQMGYEIGKQCKAIGVDINFAPVVDVNNNPNNPIINTRSFGEDPKKVACKAKLFMDGMRKAGVISCAKHFPGHGDVDVDSHVALPMVNHTKKRLEHIELVPFKNLIESDVPMIMTAHLAAPKITRNNDPATLSPLLLNDVLRKELRFDGCIITDGLGMKALTNYYEPGEIELKALLAGNDILLCSVDVPRTVNKIKEAVEQGLINEKDIDDRLARITQLKKNVPPQRTITYNKVDLNSKAAQQLKKNLYRAALTCIPEGLLIPLKSSDKISLVTISDASKPYFLEKLQQNYTVDHYPLSLHASDEECSKLAKKLKNKKHIIVSLHMNSYSGMIEMQHQEVEKKLPAYVAFVNHLQKRVFVLFGNPYTLNYIQKADTTLIAYENEEEAQEAAVEALMGIFIPRGQLPVSINGHVYTSQAYCIAKHDDYDQDNSNKN